jgi:hypothetical protein
MKIGFSLGRCIRDIVKGEVALDDVAFVIAATNIHEEDQLVQVVDSYLYRDDYLYMLDEEECRRVALALWNSNRILQPRRQGMHRHKQPENSVWVDMFPTVNSDSDAVKKAWDGYRFMLHMVENVDTDALENFK